MKLPRSLLIIITASLVLASCSAQKRADQIANRNEHKSMFPDYPFDKKLAEAALATGSSAIKGVVFTKEKTKFGYKAPLGPRIYGRNAQVMLYPVNPYFDAWYKMRKQKESKRTSVYMSEEAFAYRIATQSDEYGRFTFDKLKPGKYFLQSFINWSKSGSYEQYVGSGSNSYGGTTDYYQWKNYTTNHTDRVEEFVEVKENGEIVNVKLK